MPLREHQAAAARLAEVGRALDKLAAVLAGVPDHDGAIAGLVRRLHDRHRTLLMALRVKASSALQKAQIDELYPVR